MYEEQINAYFDDPKAREALIGAISRLVAVKSVRGEAEPGKPYGPGPAAALAEGLALASEWGLHAENHENYVGSADLNEQETKLHILGHLDVVGEGTGWSTDPYVCTEKDGMLYGRGVSDDKGPVACALMAMKAIKDMGLPLSANVRLIMGTDEESGSSDIAYYYSKHPYAPYTFTPDADFPVIHIEKGHYHPSFGRSWEPETALPRVVRLDGGFRTNVVPPEASCVVAGLTAADVEALAKDIASKTGTPFTCTDREEGVSIHCAGKNAHAASPDDGRNAISALLELLARLPLAECESTQAVQSMRVLFPYGDTRGWGLGIARQDDESGPLTLNLALMHLDDTGFSAKFDVRWPVSSNEDNCRRMCEMVLAQHGISVTADPEMTPIHRVPADSPFVTALMKSYQTFSGDTKSKPVAIGGGTYVHDIPGGVAFGCCFPGFDPKMHCPDEQADVSMLLSACKIFTHAILELCR